MAGALRKRDNVEAVRDRQYLLSCSMDLSREVREKDYSWNEPPLFAEYEYSGQTRGALTATIANFSSSAQDLMSGPVVFEWPDAEVLVAMQVTEVTIEFQPTMVVGRVHGTVLGVAHYANRPIEEARATLRQFDKQPQKRLSSGP